LDWPCAVRTPPGFQRFGPGFAPTSFAGSKRGFPFREIIDRDQAGQIAGERCEARLPVQNQILELSDRLLDSLGIGIGKAEMGVALRRTMTGINSTLLADLGDAVPDALGR